MGLWCGFYFEEVIMSGLYLLIVVNNFISVMVCGVLGYIDVGLVFLGVGVFLWLSFELVIL